MFVLIQNRGCIARPKVNGRPLLYSEQLKQRIADRAVQDKMDKGIFVTIQTLKEDHPDLFRAKGKRKGKPVTVEDLMAESTILRILKTRASDVPGGKPWVWKAAVRNKGYRANMNIRDRLNFANILLGPQFEFFTADFGGESVLYMDPVRFIIYKSKMRIEVLRRDPRVKRFMSKDQPYLNQNLPASNYGQQAHTGETIQYYMVLLARGKLAYIQMDPEFTENGPSVCNWAGENLKKEVSRLVSNNHNYPRKILCDKGRCWTASFWDAVKANGDFECVFDTARDKQPGWSPDILPHETAIAQTSNLLKSKRSFMAKGSKAETRQDLDKRVQSAVAHVNQHYRLKDLCRSFRRRMQELHDCGGTHLKY
jgi:hypothetical protein